MIELVVGEFAGGAQMRVRTVEGCGRAFRSKAAVEKWGPE